MLCHIQNGRTLWREARSMVGEFGGRRSFPSPVWLPWVTDPIWAAGLGVMMRKASSVARLVYLLPDI